LKTNVELDELVTPAVFKLAANYLEFRGTNFNDHVEFLGLNPKSDFRFADLAGVDFSDANLAGFDFTGADLRGATGANVQWDKTTILTGADTEDSLFAYSRKHDKFLAENPSVAKQIKLLVENHWTNTILGVEKLLSDKRSPHGMKIARAVFDETDDVVVRSHVLFFIRLATESSEEHREFLFNVIAKHGNELNVVRAVLRALAALYPDNKGALNLFKAYVHHDDETIRVEAMSAIINSAHLPSILQDIIPTLKDSRYGYLRRTVLARIARLEGPDYLAASRDTNVANALDYDEPITEWKMESIARAAILTERYAIIAKIAGSRRGAHEKKLEEALNVKEREILPRTSEYYELLKALRNKYGIPFVLPRRKCKRLVTLRR